MCEAIYVKCVKCLKDKYTNQQVFEARVKKFGSEEEMRAKYLCRECRKL